MKRESVLFVLLSLPLMAQAPPQNPPRSGNVIVAGSGYRLQGPGQEAAPGQLMLLSVYGIRNEVPAPVLATPGPDGWPKTLHGISVDLVQKDPDEITPLELRAIQQGFCGVPEACSTVTQITVQIPFNLRQRTGPFTYLRIRENDTPTGAVIIAPVSDRIHVLNTCDATLIQVGAASSAPPDVCTPAVLVNGRLNSLYNLIRGGDHVALWAYGLGVMAQQAPAPTSAVAPNLLFAPTTDIQLNFDYRPNAPAAPVVPGYGTTGQPTFFGYIGAGLYQVNFAIPPVPQGLPACDGVKIRSNLTVTVTGPRSYDAAHLCVATN